MVKFPVFLLLTVVVFLSVQTEAADIDTVRKQVIAFYTAEGANQADSMVAASLSSLDSSAETALSTCLPNGSWSDVDYNEVPVATWGLPSAHYGRVLTMAQAYFTEGISLYRQDTLLRKIEDALTYVQSYVYNGVTKSHWWWYTIGLPNYLSPILLLVQGHIDSSVFNTSLGTLNYLINGAPVGTGANLVWESMNHLHYALITNNTVRLGTVRTKLASVCVTSSGEGIKPDYSFHQHEAQLQTGHYGGSFAMDVARYFLFVRGTSYEVPSANSETFFKYILNGTRWAVYANCWDPSVMGRSIVRSYSTYASNAFYALLMMSVIPGDYQDTLTASAKKMLEHWPYGISSQYAGMIAPVKTSSVPPAFPYGVKHYNESDYTVSRGTDYFMSVKMHSSRMKPAELVNDEGKKSWHLSDGMTFITVKGDEYFLNNVRPALDWYRLPGTTVERKYRAAGTGYSYGTRAFVGGLSQGDYGVSAMDFDANVSDLTALKSWFFFDGIMVCLGSDITCPNTNRVETIVNQAPLSSESAPIYSDGIELPTSMGWTDTLVNVSWVHCDSIGYYFFQNTSPVILKKTVQSGTWSSLAGSASETVYSAPIYTLWFDHGINALSQKYAYAVLPAVSRTDMATYAAGPDVRVVANNDTLQAVENTQLNALGAVFWKPGTCGMVQADSPCVAFWRTTSDSLYFSATYPPHTQSTIHFTLNDPLTLLSSSKTITVSTDSITTTLSFASPGTGLGVYAVFHRIPKVFGYARVSVHDSATGDPISGALCTVLKNAGNTGFTDGSGMAIVKADTGANQVTVHQYGWPLVTVNPVVLKAGETTDVHFIIPKLLMQGIKIESSPITAGVIDTLPLIVLGLFSDSSVADTLTDGLVWSVTPEILGTVDSTGRLVTGWTPGSGSVRCSSTVLGFSAQTALTVCPIFIIQPIADAFVRGGTYTDVNYGNDSVLTIKTETSADYTRRSFLKFDLSNIAGMTVDSAVLKLYSASAVTANISVNAIADDGWQEGNVTWSNQPALGSAIDTIVISNSIGWKYANLTASLQAKAASDSLYSLGLYNPVSNGVYLDFKSRESGAPPVLEVWINPGSMGRASEPDALRALFLEISPNPFNPSAVITFSIPFAQKVVLDVFDVKGSRVTRLLDGKKEAGEYRLIWSGSQQASGVYLLRMQAGAKILERKLVYIQ
ncbi:MAG: hypothetical protein A2487_03735 [Candidatus Raymondbacteria bacterium RifOxyC12_full_50_8]|uniref:Secretion system C-terminal sorting domain-containing protein n=1 Tax=Candidatus Raymondbacteria bacterium RIFOXYD12_FULL_49_13 TaxID=1817890 RepID=A0A1F7FJI9_UNCRA|nr:MAG: hypothetical protein A2248_10225 [Candidatus Raymondbacteria bacterium RIFOXYA2_FULL_49_16]OGK06636.1 MAG: hypothetical protein A2519_11025 [Candidatus Raymondbacteria bacterium RIFOXYD12_FULL_49_13]OGK06690.1 MAG: hypothetical protein A2487_03735 [Candidatus Raymondbacteria bacterium RifOxyC12_full_50_8]OGP43430.1 MAG: hypothetical protein A2324_20045 [Candidatus Raymondbacteria bacterium RIFOXYB2_FULL_49_35]